ncbi:MAG: hypothetical protein AAGA77_17190 [Bacteroidota bacterium]
MRTLFIYSILFTALSTHAQESIEGIWNTGKENTKIEIAEVEDGIYEGKILSSDNENAKVEKALLREVNLIDGEWKGKLFAPKKKKWMDAVLMKKENRLHIKVKAGFMSKTIKWTKEEP